MRAYRIRVSGDVQGVFYRHNAKKIAEKLGIVGWVKNKQDGSVEAQIQGDEKKLKQFIEWAYEGSPMSSVDLVEVEVIDVEVCFKNFEVR